MSDDELITTIAELWVIKGGDAEGLDWCYQRIREKVEELYKLLKEKE